QIGESLTPGVGGVLDLLGIADEFDRVPCKYPPRARVIWETREPVERSDGLAAAMIDRGAFDLELYRLAGEHGVIGVEGARVRLARSADGLKAEVAHAGGHASLFARVLL